MKTQGIQAIEGYLVFDAARTQAVPPQFWARLKHEMTKAGLLDAFAAEYRRENDAVREERKAATWANAQRLSEGEREQSLFRRWVERVVGPQTLWPWQRGWTDELVDAYLEPAAKARAA